MVETSCFALAVIDGCVGHVLLFTASESCIGQNFDGRKQETKLVGRPAATRLQPAAAPCADLDGLAVSRLTISDCLLDSRSNSRRASGFCVAGMAM